MSEIPGAQQLDALPPGPLVQVRGVAVPAGGAGKPGVDMKVGNVQNISPLSTGFDFYYNFFSGKRNTGGERFRCRYGLPVKTN